MSGVKLSELATTTVLDGTELITMLQDGWNRNTTIQSIIGPTNTRSIDNTNLIYTLSSQIGVDLLTINNELDTLTYTISTIDNVLTTNLDNLTTQFYSSTASNNAAIVILDTKLDAVSATNANQINNLTGQIDAINTELNQPKVSVSPIFITDVTNNNGLIQKTWKSDTVPVNHIVDEITVDSTTSLVVSFEWDGPDDEWMGQASINNTTIPTQNVTRIGNTRRFEATANLTNVDGITARANGGTHVVPITLLGQGPQITNVTFGLPPETGGYRPPMFLDHDQVQITVEFDSADVASYTLYSGTGYATVSVVDQSITPTTTANQSPSATFLARVDTQSTSIVNLPIKISAKNSFGTEGNQHTSINTIPCRHGPEITGMSFGSYPGVQSELKNNDTIDITLEFDTNNVTQVNFYNSNSYANDGSTRSVTPTNRQATTTLKIGTNTTTVQSLYVRARPRGVNSNWGTYTNSSATLQVNNVYPTFNGYNVVYPTGQQALKGTESATVTLNVGNQGASPTYTYNSVLGDVVIPSINAYTSAKVVSCTNPGVYRPNTNNYRLTVNREENDSTSTYNGVIKIADKAPSLTVTYPGNRMRSGGNDGTSVQTYQIQMTSDQQLQSFSMNSASTAGTLDGSWVGSNSNTIWRRNLKVSDDDSKGTFNWQLPVAKNLAGTEIQQVTTGGSYTLGGFVSRTLAVASQGWQVSANVEAVTYNKVQISWSKKNLSTRASIGDVSRPQTAAWSLDRLSPKPITVNILDSGASNASSSPTTLTIEETV